jgi:hypothetical protein
MMFVVPTTEFFLGRLSTTQRRSMSIFTSQRYRNVVGQRTPVRTWQEQRYWPSVSSHLSLSTSTSSDNDNNNIVTTSTDKEEKSAAELEAIKAARDVRK